MEEGTGQIHNFSIHEKIHKSYLSSDDNWTIWVFCMPFRNLTDTGQRIPGITNKKVDTLPYLLASPWLLNNLAAPCQPCPTRCIKAKLDNKGRERGEERNHHFYENNLDALLTCLTLVYLLHPSVNSISHSLFFSYFSRIYSTNFFCSTLSLFINRC